MTLVAPFISHYERNKVFHIKNNNNNNKKKYEIQIKA